MQTLLLPAGRPGIGTAPFALPPTGKPCRYRLAGRPNNALISSLPFSPLQKEPLNLPQLSKRTRILASSPVSTPYTSPNEDPEKAKLLQVAKRLQDTARYFKRLGTLGFWGQLVCTLVAAVILSFSVVITGKVTSPFTFYSTAGGIAAAFISVFWSFGYLRLSEKLQRSANEPSKAPPRADVVKSLRNGIVVNLLGMGAAILGNQATVGLLVAKALTTSTNPYQGLTPGSSPVLALDVFLVQASANTVVSHFLGLVFSLELLRSVTLPTSEGIPVPRAA
ncbi:protein TIC 21, chloroplastic [Lycium barbarum]|uniref:protein TIC 21, chloroplastic n=1 Tax=Lycium barbarum TaxID=112863 RepID=UPI00293EBECB|nr:protein TIC 21, chloroplastic [Lycium barbarum]